MKSKALAVQLIPETTEKRVNRCQLAGHSPSSAVRIEAPRSSGIGLVRTAVPCLCLFFSVETPAQEQEITGILDQSPLFTTFEAPGAGTESHQGTVAYSINTSGAIAGYYLDASSVKHGFVRSSNGTITTFEVPGEAGTIAQAINTSGTIAGSYSDASNVFHAFVRSSNGTITTFEILGAAGTVAQAINTSGTIAGSYSDSSNVYHSFVRAADDNHLRGAGQKKKRSGNPRPIRQRVRGYCGILC